jgi:hypothetical protein
VSQNRLAVLPAQMHISKEHRLGWSNRLQCLLHGIGKFSGAGTV